MIILLINSNERFIYVVNSSSWRCAKKEGIKEPAEILPVSEASLLEKIRREREWLH